MENMQEVEGRILTRVIIEIAGKPEGHVIKSMDLLIKKAKADENFNVKNIEVSDIKEEEGAFTIFSEIELETKNLDALAWFCFDYMPASVEIIEPRVIKYDAKHLTTFLNDIQTRIHAMDLALKSLSVENQKIKQNGAALMRNMLYSLISKKRMYLDEISKIMGIPLDDVEKIINELIEQKRVVKEEEKYSWVK